MNKKEKIKLVNKLVQHHKTVNKEFNSLLTIVGGDLDSPIGKAVYMAMDSYLDLVATQIGDRGRAKDQDSWLAWFIYENKCGKLGRICLVGKHRYRVETVSDLIDVIDSHNNL